MLQVAGVAAVQVVPLNTAAVCEATASCVQLYVVKDDAAAQACGDGAGSGSTHVITEWHVAVHEVAAYEPS